MNTMIEIVDVDEGKTDFSVLVTFNDGISGEVDFSDLIKNDKYFQHLNTREKFIAFGLEHGTMVWANHLSIAPEWVKEHLTSINHCE